MSASVEAGKPIIGCGAGADISARFAEAGGADIIIIKKDQMVICHGGAFDEPENVGKALKKMPGIAGFFGASSIERLPTERAIRGQVEAFKSLTMAEDQRPTHLSTESQRTGPRRI